MVADAETLFRGTTRALLIHLDYRGLIRLHWSPLLLGEMSDALVRTGRKATVDAALHHEQLMISALPNAMIDTQDVQQQFRMVQHAVKSTKDMHVAACALALRAANAYGVNPIVLASTNEADFNPLELSKLGILFRQPDDFLLGLFQRSPDEFAHAFGFLRDTLSSAPSVELLLQKLAADGQRQTAEALLTAHRAGVAVL